MSDFDPAAARARADSAQGLAANALNAFADRAVSGVSPGSPLDAADRETDSLMSEQVRPALYVAADSLRTGARLAADTYRDPKYAPPVAIGVLLRSCIEAASLVVWILGAPNRDECTRRALRQQRRSAVELGRFSKVGGEEPRIDERPLAESQGRTSRLTEVALRLGIPDTAVNEHVSSSKVIEQASVILAFPDLLGHWQVLSGAAHGYEWAVQAVTVEHRLGRGANGQPLHGYSVNPEAVDLALFGAYVTFQSACSLWQRATGSEEFPNNPASWPEARLGLTSR